MMDQSKNYYVIFGNYFLYDFTLINYYHSNKRREKEIDDPEGCALLYK